MINHAQSVTIIVFLLALFELLGGRSYVDEVLCIFSIIYVLYLLSQNLLIKHDRHAIYIPVSYTHLDVYKRQVQRYANGRNVKGSRLS